MSARIQAQQLEAVENERRFQAAVAKGTDSIASVTSGTIAVLEFPSTGGRVNMPLMNSVREAVTGRLASHRKLTVIERSQLIQLKIEAAYQDAETNLTAEEAARLGKELRVNAVVLGSTSAVGARGALIYMRAVEVRSHRVLVQSVVGPINVP